MAKRQVQKKAADDRKWTVMVFMGADTIQGNAPLGNAALADIAEMEAVGSGGPLNIFVQVHGLGVPQRYHIGIDGGVAVPKNQRDLVGGRALSHFIETSLMEVGHRRKDHSLLVLWGHAYDFAIGRAPTRGGAIDALDFAELKGVLLSLQDRMQQRYGGDERPTLDMIGFDACDLSTVEMACQLHPFAKYLLGSQIGIPIPGWPYRPHPPEAPVSKRSAHGSSGNGCVCCTPILRVVQGLQSCFVDTARSDASLRTQ